MGWNCYDSLWYFKEEKIDLVKIYFFVKRQLLILTPTQMHSCDNNITEAQDTGC